MKPRHSNSLILIWRVAEFEARQLKAPAIEPTHLLLGLCKVVDLNLPLLVSEDAPDRDGILEELLREVRRLKNVFRAAGLDAKVFRRRLRRTVGARRFVFPDSERLHRSKAAKQVFADAERIAVPGGSVVYPVHLLYATLHGDDNERDEVMKELGINRNHLLEAAKGELVFRYGRSTNKDRTRWN
jgi:cell division FtsZ-interacting protein ZapD